MPDRDQLNAFDRLCLWVGAFVVGCAGGAIIGRTLKSLVRVSQLTHELQAEIDQFRDERYNAILNADTSEQWKRVLGLTQEAVDKSRRHVGMGLVCVHCDACLNEFGECPSCRGYDEVLQIYRCTRCDTPTPIGMCSFCRGYADAVAKRAANP